MNDVTFKVSAKKENVTKSVIEANGFKIIIDEPKNMGGTNEGPNPVEVLLASFAGCLNVMVHIVAREMNLKMDNISIDVEGDLNPMKLMGKSNKDRAGFKEVRVNISSDMDVDEETKERFLKEVENRCPISDNLKNGTNVGISLN